MKAYVDLAKLSENQRIKYIGKLTLETRTKNAMVTDADAGKAERYKKKMAEWFPTLKLGEIMSGGNVLPGCRFFTVEPPDQGQN